jgi:hypothetical protein
MCIMAKLRAFLGSVPTAFLNLFRAFVIIGLITAGLPVTALTGRGSE